MKSYNSLFNVGSTKRLRTAPKTPQCRFKEFQELPKVDYVIVKI